MLWQVVGLLGLVAPGVPPVETPRPAAVELAWQGPPECPDQVAMLERIEALAQTDPAGEGTLEVDGQIEPTAVGFRLRLRTAYGDASDERVLVDADCHALGDAAALVVAVSIDPAIEERPASYDSPTQTQTPENWSPVAPPTLPEPSSAPKPRATEPEPIEIPRRIWRPESAFVGVAPQLEFGALPGLSGGPRVAAGARWSRASLAAYGFWGAPRRTDVVAGGAGLAQMGAGGVQGCAVLDPGAVQIPLCGLAEGGALRVSSRGLDPRNVLSYPWLAFGARGGIERRWGRVGLYSAVEALIPVVRTRILVGTTSAFDTWAASIRLLVGLQIFFATDSA